MTYTGIQMFMEKLNQLINCSDNPLFNNSTIIRERPQLQLLYEELGSMIQTLFIDEHQDLRDLEKVNDLKKRFIDAAEEAEYIVDLFLSGVHIRNNRNVWKSFKSVVHLFVSYFHITNNAHFPTSRDFKRSLHLDGVLRSFNLVKVEITSMNIDSMNMYSSPRPNRTLNQSAAAPVSFTRNPQASKKLFDEIVVGFDSDFELIRDKLVEDQKKVDVVSIVGMGGIGKTTLAKMVFNDRFIVHHFYVRVWVTVSQKYDKRAVLIQILESICGQIHLQKENIESGLREMVHKQLMGKRYLIVIDDIWDIETWDNLKLFFPHDNNGSRLLLTTRLTDVAKHANSDGLIHQLGYLNKERSWELLCKKVFHGIECPEWSVKYGMKISENCHGLPLALAVIAGVLAKESWSKKLWVKIAYRARWSHIAGDENGSMETLGLSYTHLPCHLRECFLYLGGFPEDYEYQVRRLIRLWVAEGFIEQDGNRRLDDIAEGYLMDLIDRNLVLVAHRSKSSGAVKACKVHDLVRELCMIKAKEERFSLQTERLKLSSDFSNVTTPTHKPVRMFIHHTILGFRYPSTQNLRSKLCFSDSLSLRGEIITYFNFFVLLRVLDLQNCRLEDFPKGMKNLVHLRYLAIRSSSEHFPSSICSLWNLQTLIYITNYGSEVNLPINISDLVNLRHLWSDKRTAFILPFIDKPLSLQTISNVKLGVGVQNLLQCFPYIKELKCNTTDLDIEFDFKSLTYLEKLKLTGSVKNRITFPATLTALALKRCELLWNDMSIIQSLPNLHVLKLSFDAFTGSCWNTDEQEFRQLKFLRLEWLYIEQWEAYTTSFPCLGQLEIINCYNLEEIPLGIGDIPTLEIIKVKGFSHSVGESVRRIQEEQHDLGNYDLKIEVIERT